MIGFESSVGNYRKMFILPDLIEVDIIVSEREKIFIVKLISRA